MTLTFLGIEGKAYPTTQRGTKLYIGSACIGRVTEQGTEIDCKNINPALGLESYVNNWRPFPIILYEGTFEDIEKKVYRVEEKIEKRVEKEKEVVYNEWKAEGTIFARRVDEGLKISARRIDEVFRGR